jgi:hypothetical protein
MLKLCRPGKVVAIYGPRRCGKTTLVSKFIAAVGNRFGKVHVVSGDDMEIRERLSTQSIEGLRAFVGDTGLLVVDEAQRIPEIGLNLKIIVDNMPQVAVVATGSSAFDLAGKIRESLTGRCFNLRLFPLAQMEIDTVENRFETLTRLPTRLVYGSYPDVVTAGGDVERERYLKEVAGSYLYRDALAVGGIKHADKLDQLLRLLGYQIGSQVSLTELGQKLEMDKNTVAHYIDLLEKSFILYRLGGFSRNLRNEVTRMAKYFFWDVGVRNAVVGDFRPLSSRDDVGQLWENYLVIERAKRREYLDSYGHDYFWRTHTQQEIDLVEDKDGALHGYEFKWTEAKASAPKEWRRAYPDATFEVVNRENYLKFIGA